VSHILRFKILVVPALLGLLSLSSASELSVGDVVSHRDDLEGKSLVVGGVGWVSSNWAFREVLLFSSRESFDKGAGGDAIVLKLTNSSLRQLEDLDGCRIVVSGIFERSLLGRRGAVANGGMRNVELVETSSDCVGFGERDGWIRLEGAKANRAQAVSDAWLDSIGIKNEAGIISAFHLEGDKKASSDLRASYHNSKSRLYWFVNKYLPQWMKSPEGRKGSSVQLFSDMTGESSNIRACYSKENAKDYCVTMHLDHGQTEILPFEYAFPP
jgi:hypothetical protein